MKNREGRGYTGTDGRAGGPSQRRVVPPSRPNRFNREGGGRGEGQACQVPTASFKTRNVFEKDSYIRIFLSPTKRKIEVKVHSFSTVHVLQHMSPDSPLERVHTWRTPDPVSRLTTPHRIGDPSHRASTPDQDRANTLDIGCAGHHRCSHRMIAPDVGVPALTITNLRLYRRS